MKSYKFLQYLGILLIVCSIIGFPLTNNPEIKVGCCMFIFLGIYALVLMQVLTNKDFFQMNEIVKRPPDYIQYGYGLKDCQTNIWAGEQVYYMFYEKGPFKKDSNIHCNLKKINWVPDKDKTYKCWWYSTNPADPCDPGEDILLYVEEWNIYMDNPILRQQIIEKLYIN